MTNLDSILKSKDITLSRKVCLVKAMVFPVVLYGCESWTVKKAEQWRTDAPTEVLEMTPESPLDSKEIHPKGTQSWIFIGRTDAETESPAPWPPDAKNWLIWKDPGAWKDRKTGGEGDDRGWDGWMASLIQWTWVWVNFGSWWWREVFHVAVHGVTKSWTRLNNWTELNWVFLIPFFPQED